MNKIYKVIFNRNKNRYEIVSELASSRGGKCKVKAGKQIAKLFMTGLLATFLSSVALAADEEVKVKYDETTGTIKIVKKGSSADDEILLATYAVGGSMTPIIDNGKNTAKNVIALGQNSTVLQSNTIAIGTDAHAGNVGGSDDTNGRIAIGTKTVASGERSIALGNMSSTNNGSYNIVQGRDSIGIGTSTSVFGYSGVSIGRRNIIGIPDPELVSKDGVLTTKSKTKYSEEDPGGNSVIVGAYNVAYGNRSNVIGTYSRAMGSNSVAIGSGVQSLSDGSIAIGKGSGYEFEEGSRKVGRREKEFYGRDWELPPEYKVLKQVLSTDIAGDKQYEKEGSTWENGGTLPKYNNYGAGSSDPGGFIVEGKNALGIGTYTQVRGDSAIGLATGEMTADLPKKDKDKSQYARDMRKIMDMEETLYAAKEALKSGSTSDKATLEANVKTAEESLAAAKKEFRKNYLSKYSFVEGEGALGVGRQILAQGDRSMAVGDYAKAISNDAIAYGGQTLANGTNSMAMGGNAHVGTTDKSFDNSMAIGSHTNVQAGNAVALGAFSQVTGKNSLALGFGKQSGEAITYNNVSGEDSTLIGSYGTIQGNNSILIGSNGNIANDRVVGLGNNINIEAADQNDQENNTAGSVFLGDHAGYVKDSKRARSLGEVTLVGSEEKKELTESLSSTKGALRDYTKDFIYIYMLENQDDGTKIGAPIAVRSDFAGGDSTVGVVSVGSTYEQTFENLDKIKEHHKKVGSLITVPVEVTVQVMKNGISLGKQQQTRYFAADATQEQINSDSTLSDEDKKKVWDTIQESRKKADTKYTVFETRRIQNVAPGLIGSNSTDAINGSQLFATNQMLGNLVGSLKKTFGDNVTITEDGQISVSGEGTLGWIAKAKVANGSNGTVDYQVGKDDKITKDNLKEKGSAIEAADQLVFQAGKNIGLVQTPDTLTISTIDTPSFTSVELRGETKDVDDKKVTEVTKIDSSGMKVVTETSTPASDGSTTPTVTEKVSTTVGKDGVSTDGSVKVTNGTTDLVTIDKGTDGSGTDQEYGKIGLDGKNGSNATITVDRGTKSLNDDVNIGVDPNQPVSETNESATMDRITYTTTGPNNTVINHEVATMDDGLFFSGDSADGKDGNVKNTFGRKLSEETKIIGGVDLGLQADATAEQREAAIAAKLTDGNIGVISDGSDTLTVKLAKNLMGLDSTTYTSPTTKTDDGDDATSTMKVDGNGVRFVDNNGDTVNNTPTFTTDGITGGGKQITNIDSGLKNGNTTISISDLKDPNKTETINSILNNAVNVSDLKTIVDAGFKLNTSGQDNAGASTVKIGDTINIIDGANTKVSAIDDRTTGTHTFHIDVNGLPMSYVDSDGNPLTKIGDKFYKTSDLVNGVPPAGTDEVPANKVTSNVSMLDNTGSHTGVAPQIKNVGSGLVDNNGKTIKPNELLNITDTNNPVLKNAVNVGDLKQVAAAAKTEVTGTGAAEVTKKTAKDGHDVYNVHVDKLLTVKPVTPGTLMERGADGKYYAPSEIQDKTFVSDGNGGGSWYAKADVDEYGTPLEGKSPLEQQPTALDQNTLKTSVTNPNGNGPTIVDNVKSVLDGSNQFIKDLTGLKPTTDADKLNSVSTVSDLQKVALTPLFFEGDTAENATTNNAFGRKLSEKAKIVGGQKDVNQLTDSNIGVVSNGTDTLTIKLAKELQNLTSVTTGSGDNKTVMNQAGVTITSKTNNPDGTNTNHSTSITKDGVATDGTVKVTNGKDGKDLVTIAKGTETDPNATDKEFGTVAINGKNGSNATLTVDRGTKSVTDSANVGKDPTKPIDKDNPAGMDRLTYTTGIGDNTIEHQVATLDDGFFLTTEHTEEDKTRTVLFNNTIKVLDGANTKVSAMGGEDGTHTFSIDVTGLPMTYTATDANGKTQDVHKVGGTYTLADGTKLVQVGDKFYKPDQVEKVNGTPQVKADQEDKDTKLNNVSLTSPVANTAPTLSNVGSALKKSDGTRITMSDLDDSSVYPTNNPIWNNAVNVGDLKAATDAARTEVTGTGKAIVTKKTGDKGQNIYNVHVDPIVDVVGADGSEVVRGDDGKYYNPTDIANKTYIPNADGNGGNWYDNGDLTNGEPNQGAKPQNVTPTDVKNNFVNPNGTDSIVLDNVKSGIGGEVKDAAGKNTFIDNINKVVKKSDDGTVVSDAISENTVVNAKDLKNVVDTGFKLNTSGHSGEAKTVKIGETIKVVDGANTRVSDITPKDGVHEFHIDVTGLPMTYTVSQTGGTDAPVSVSKVGDTYQLADGTKLVKVGDKFYKPSQLVDPNADQPQVRPEEVDKNWTVNDSISLVNKDGSNNAPTLKNVGSGLKDANGNSTTLDQAVGSNAVNVDDLRTLGKAATTEVTGTGAAEVTKVTGANGQNIYNVHVDKLMTVKPVDPKANITRGGDGKYYNKDDIAGKTFVSDGNGGGSWYNASDVDAKTGKPLEGKSALAKQPIALDQSKLKNSVVNPNGDGATIVDNVKSVFDSNIGNGADIGSNVDEIKDGSVISNTGSNQFINDLTKLNDQVDPNATDAEAEKTRAKKDEEKLNSVSTVRDLQKVALTPLFFEGDVAQDEKTANTFDRKLSEKTKIVGGQKDVNQLTDDNIGVVSNGTDTLTIKLAKNLVNLTSVETGSDNNKTKMTENGITTTVKDGDTFKVTTTTPNGLATTEVKLDSEGMPKGESTTTMVTTDGVTITTQTPQNGDKPASTTETKLSKDGLATDGTIKVTGDNAKDLVTIAKETDPNATDKEFGTVTIDGKNGSKATLTVDRGTKSVTDSANVGTDPTKPIDKDNPAAGMDRLTYTTTGPNNETINHEVATLDDGFMLTTSTDVANSKAPANVKLNHTIKFTDGANTKVSTVTSKDGVHELHVDVTGLPVTYTASVVDDQGNPTNTQNVSKVGDTYQLEDGTKLVKSGDKYYKLDQIENGVPKAGEKGLTIDNSVRVINPEDPSKTAKITNVAPGVDDTDAVNMSQLKQKAAAATTEVTGTGAAEVTKVTGANGQNIYNVHVDKLMTVKAVDSATQVARGGDGKYYNADDIAGKTFVPSENKWYNTADVDATTGKPLEGKSALANQPLALDQSKLKNSVVNPNGDGATIVDNVKSGIGGEAGNGIQNGTTIDGTTGNNTFIKNLDKVGKPASEGGIDKTTVVNAGDLKNLADTPLFFSGDSADGVAAADGTDKNTFARKLSQETKIVGGVDLGLQADATAEQRKAAIADKLTDNNIGVVSNGTDTLTIKLAKNLVNLTSVETGSGNNKTKMTKNGITTTVKDGDTFKVTTTTPNGLATTEVKLDSEGMPKGESTTTMVTTDGVTITTQTPKNGDKPASTTETKLSKDGLATDGTIKVTGDNAKDLVTIGKGTETDPNATDKEFGTVAIDGKNGSNATLTVDRGTKSVTDSANVGKDPTKPIDEDNPVAGMDRLTYTTTGPDNTTINHEVATLDDGFFLTTEHTEEDKTRTVLFNNTIKVLDGANTKVSAMGGEKGTHTFSIDVTGLPVTYTATKTDANGAPTGEPVDVSKVGDGYQLADGTKLEKAGDKYYTPDQLENGQPKPDAEGLTIKQSVSLVQDNGAPATLERVGSGRRNGMNAKDTPMDWNSILNAAADNAEVNNMLTNAANIGDVRDAIKSITNGTDDNAIGGFGLTGNNGEVKQDLGKTITVKGGIANKVDEAGQDLHVPEKSTTDKNTYVNVKNNEMVVEIAKDLIDLDSVTVGSATTGKGETTKITGKDVTIKDKAGNTNTSTATKDELTNANGDKTTVEAGKVDVSKKNADGTTSSTNIDGSKITLENKDKDSNTVGSKTDIGTDGIRITYKDDKGKTDPNKDVSLTDKGLNNGGNQIKNVGSGLVYKDGSKITDIAGITDQDILSNGVNVGDLQKAINSVTNSSNGGGFGLTGNNGQIMQDLGKTITIKGGIANKKDDSGKDLPAKSTTDQNTYVNVKDSEMVVEIAKDLTDLDSVTIGNVDKDGKGGTVINKDSMTVKDKDGKNSTNIGAGTIGTSKTDGNGNTSSTNINGSHMTLENKDKNGKLTGPKTEVSNKGITITPVDKDGNPIEGKKVELSDKGLDNGGNQIKHVDSGLKKENGDSVKLEDAADDMLNNAVNVGDLQSVNKKLKDDIINISNQVDDIKNSAPVVYTDAKGKRVSKQGDKFVNEDGIEVKPHEIKLSLVNADGKTTKPSTLQNVAEGDQDTDAVNVKQLKEATKKPLTFNGDDGSYRAELGEIVAIKGGANSADLTDNNIGVIADSSTKTLNVKLSKKLKGLESAEFVDNNGNTTNITGDGVHISGGNGSNVSLTSQGLNNGGNRITNVAPGVEATDAVNVSQLNQVGAALHNRINNVAKGAYGGVASAGAMASLPQAYLPGKSMVAAGASHYRGESAVALGASRISDNGKIILKLNASHNTSGNTMVGAGVGYQF